MSTPRRKQGDRRHSPAAAPPLNLRPSEEDLRELREPDDLPYPDECWWPRRPEFVIVIDDFRDPEPSRARSLAEFLQRLRAPDREPEADHEAEP